MPATRKVSEGQLEVLVGWMESHPLQAKATQAGGRRAMQLSHSLWNRLATKLNAVGNGVTKTAKEWRQYWSDFKCKIKKKGLAVRQHGSGGGLSWSDVLTPKEARVLYLMGTSNAIGNVYVDNPRPPPPRSPPALRTSPILASRHEPVEVSNPSHIAEPICPSGLSGASSLGARPRKRKRKARAVVDECPAEISRPHTVPAVDVDDSSISEDRVRLKLEERRVAMEERRLAMEERRLIMEERRFGLEETKVALEERKVELEERRVSLGERSTLEERKVALAERATQLTSLRLEEDRQWRTDFTASIRSVGAALHFLDEVI